MDRPVNGTDQCSAHVSHAELNCSVGRHRLCSPVAQGFIGRKWKWCPKPFSLRFLLGSE